MTDQMQSEIVELNLTVEQIDDPRSSYAIVKERIRRYRSLGRQVPEELSRLERHLVTECLHESQGR